MTEWELPSDAYIDAMSRVRPKNIGWGATKDMDPGEISRALRNSYGPETARQMEQARIMADLADQISDHEPFADRKRDGLQRAGGTLLGGRPEYAPFHDGPEYSGLNVSIPEPQPLDKSLSDVADTHDESTALFLRARKRFIEQRRTVAEQLVAPLVNRIDDVTDDDEFNAGPNPSVGYDPEPIDMGDYEDELRRRVQRIGGFESGERAGTSMDSLKEQFDRYTNHYQKTMNHTPVPKYNYLPPRYPGERSIHRVEFDDRTYYFRQLNDDGDVRLTRYELPGGDTLRRTDTLDMDDIADPVLDVLDANGVNAE